MTYEEYKKKKNGGSIAVSSGQTMTYEEFKQKRGETWTSDNDTSSATDWVKKYQGLLNEAREAGDDTSLLSSDYRERINSLLAEYEGIKGVGKSIYKNFDEYAQELMALGGKYDTATGTQKDLYAVKPTNNWTGVILGDNPVMQTPEQMIAPTSKAEKNTWFQKGALKDGVTLGNVGKAILGTHQDLGENLYAGVGGMVEKAVDTLATIAPYIVNGMFYQNGGGYAPVAYQQMHNQAIDVAKKGTEDFVQQDLYDEKEVAKALTKYSVGNLVGGSDMSVLGGKSDALVQSGGQMAATLALSSAGVPWWLTTGVTAFGGESENALKQGASLDEAAMSSAIAAGSEIITEKLFGGSGLGEQGLMNLEPLTRGITNRTVKILADYGVDLTTEGFEETLTEVINNLGSALYREENLKDILVSEEALTGYLDAFIGGMVMSGAMNVGKVSNHLKQQTDYRADLTKQEQQVVDKEYERLLAEKDGELTNKQKNDLYNRVIRDMEKGYISTDTIEEVLGGDTYKAYQDAVKSEDALKTEFETLNKMKQGDMTGEQIDRRAELKELLKQSESEAKSSQLKSKLSEEVAKLAKDSRLVESYNEVGRRTQKFEADLTQYDAKQQEVIKKAIESGILNNSNRTHEFVDLVARISADKGVLFDFTNNAKLKESGFAIDGKQINGYVTKDGVTVNIQSAKSLNSVVGHEISHVLEGTELYTELQNAVIEYAKTKGDYQGRYDTLSKLYEGVEGANIDAELTADLVGDYLFTDADFINNLSINHRNVFEKVYDEVKYLLKVATAGSKEAQQLEKVKRAFEKAYRETKNTTEDGGVKYSVTESFTDSNGTQFDNAVLLDTDFFDGTSPRNWGEKLKEEVYNRAGTDPFILPIVDENGNTTILQFANPKDRVKKDGGAEHRVLDKLTSTSDNISKLAVIHVDEIVSVSEENTPYYTTENKHGWMDKNGWLHRNANVINKRNGNIYNLTIDIAKAEDGRIILYATDGKIKKVGNVNVNSLKIKGSRQNSDFETKVAQEEPVVKKQFSLSEIENAYQHNIANDDILGAELMVEAAAHNAGYDIEAYHGTDSDFWTFSLGRRGHHGEKLGVGYYFTNNQEEANVYTSHTGKVKHVFLDIKKPVSHEIMTISQKEWGKFLDYAEQYKDEYIDDAWKGNSINKEFELRDILYYDNDADLIKAFIDSTAGRNSKVAEGYMKMLKDSIGYDGVKYKNGTTEVYVAFTPEQIKLADAVTYDDAGNVIPLSERFKHSNSDIRYSISSQGQEQRSYGNYNVYGKDVALETDEIDPVAALAQTPIDDAPVREDYEAVAPMPAVDSTRQVYAEPDDFAPLPNTGKKLRSWPVTSTESDVVDGEIDLEDLDQDKIHYQPISNKKTIGNANAMLGSMGYDKAVSYMKQRFISNKVSLDDIALGERLIQEAVARKDHKTASDLIMDISILGTELGQKVQALSIIKKLTPEGQLKMLYKTVERGKAKGDKAFANIEVTPEQAEKILSARNADGSYDQEKLNAAVEEVKQEIADQMPVTALEKINEWRYLAMLGNPKTHIRNMVSNAAMYATRQIKNAVARTGETIAGNRIDRTKTWKMASKDVKEFAKQAADEMYSGDMGNKYSESSSIKSKRDIFRFGALNAAADFNSKALSKEDTWFSKPAYRESLQEYLAANGIRTKTDLEKNSKLIAKAKEYAKKQALEATFQQDSYIANKISEIESRNAFLNVGVGAVLPFKKTPINIAKTAVAYSPLGIARNIADAVKVNKGEMAASEAIDHVAQTLTGTSLAVLGFFLAKSGFLNGAGKDDKEGQYDYQLGKQAYSVNINGDTYSLSWLSPVAMPLFVGVNVYEVLVEEKELDYNVVMDALFKTLDPLNEMSFLSSLNDVLSSYESGMAAFGGMAEAALQSYVTSFIPTLSSQIAQMTDTKKRTTKVAADSGQDFLDDTWNQIKYKIPGLRQTLEPSTDIWGNEIPITDNLITKAIETFIAPYAKKDNIATQVDEEIKNIYRLTGETGVIPNVPDNYITYKDVKYEMSAEDYTQFKKDYGQIAYKLMEQLVSNYTYQRASAVDKADMMKEVFTYARDEAKRNYLATQGVEYTNATKNNVEYYRENNIKGAIETDMTLDEYVFRRDNPAKYQASSAIGGYDVYQKYAEDTKGMDLAKKAEYISRMDLTIDQKNRLINSETDRKEPIDLTGLENYPSFEEFEYAKENPESYALAKSLGGYEAYKVYAEALGDIKADKNQNGDTISNSRKNKVYNYIYSLDIPDIEKHILFKSQYTSTDTYNRQILEYLDSRDDISWDEMKSILTKLGFKITSSGAIRW